MVRSRRALGSMMLGAAFAFGAGCTLLVDTGGLSGGASGEAKDGGNASDSIADGTRDERPDDGRSGETAPSDGPSSRYASVVLADRPVVYWRMGIASGTSVMDETGGGNSLTLHGACTLGEAGAIAGDPDTSVRFDGQTAYGTALDPRALDFNGNVPFTLELWARHPNEGGTYQHFLGNIADNGGVTARDGYIFYLGHLTPDRLGFEWDVTGTQNVVDGTPASDGVWGHYVGAFDGQNLSLYADGVLTGAKGSHGGSLNPRTSPLIVGAVAPGSNSFSGWIDEVAIYATRLTAAQIAHHHDVGIGH